MLRSPFAKVPVGLALGLVVATGLSVWVTFVRAMSGTAPFDRLETSYPVVVCLYYLGGLTGGLLLSVAWPLRRWLLGSAFLGMLGTFPLYFGAALMQAPRSRLMGGENVTGALLLAVLVGMPLGAWRWLDSNSTRPLWLEALLFPTTRTVSAAWAAALVASGGSYVFLTRRMRDWPFALVITAFLLLFVVPLATALIVTLRFGKSR